MSYRELRNFTEILRSLDFPNLISLKSFDTPNFELVVDILEHLILVYDPKPDIRLGDDLKIDTIDQRVAFLLEVNSYLIRNLKIKLNLKKIYSANKKSISELLKFANFVYKIYLQNKKSNQLLKQKEDIANSSTSFAIKPLDIKTIRTLANEITQSGAKLYDLLNDEFFSRQERLKTLRFLDQVANSSENSREHTLLVKKIRQEIENTEKKLKDSEKESDELEAEKKSLLTKIERKNDELKRTETRLKSLEHGRPQFAEETKKLTADLNYFHDIYVQKYRVFDQLSKELEQFRIREEEKMIENEKKLKKMRENLIKEEVEIMRGSSNVHSASSSKKAPGKIFESNDSKKVSYRRVSDSEESEDDQISDDEPSINERITSTKSGYNRRDQDDSSDLFQNDDDDDEDEDEDEDDEDDEEEDDDGDDEDEDDNF